MVSVSDSWSIGCGFGSRPVHSQATTLGKLLSPKCLCHQAVQFGTGQRAVMLCGREGNRRSGVPLAMRHRLYWFIHLRAQRPRKGGWAPRLRSKLGMIHFTFTRKCKTAFGGRMWPDFWIGATAILTRHQSDHSKKADPMISDCFLVAICREW